MGLLPNSFIMWGHIYWWGNERGMQRCGPFDRHRFEVSDTDVLSLRELFFYYSMESCNRLATTAANPVTTLFVWWHCTAVSSQVGRMSTLVKSVKRAAMTSVVIIHRGVVFGVGDLSGLEVAVVDLCTWLSVRSMYIDFMINCERSSLSEMSSYIQEGRASTNLFVSIQVGLVLKCASHKTKPNVVQCN